MIEKRTFAVGAIVLLALTTILGGAINAQTSTSRDAMLESIRASLIQAIGGQDNAVEVSIARNILMISCINSSLNQSSHGVRDNEASTIAPIVSRTIAGKPEFKNIHTIRVLYVVRLKQGSHENIIDTIDFRKDPGGGFQFHTT